MSSIDERTMLRRLLLSLLLASIMISFVCLAICYNIFSLRLLDCFSSPAWCAVFSGNPSSGVKGFLIEWGRLLIVAVLIALVMYHRFPIESCRFFGILPPNSTTRWFQLCYVVLALSLLGIEAKRTFFESAAPTAIAREYLLSGHCQKTKSAVEDVALAERSYNLLITSEITDFEHFLKEERKAQTFLESKEATLAHKVSEHEQKIAASLVNPYRVYFAYSVLTYAGLAIPLLAMWGAGFFNDLSFAKERVEASLKQISAAENAAGINSQLVELRASLLSLASRYLDVIGIVAVSIAFELLVGFGTLSDSAIQLTIILWVVVGSVVFCPIIFSIFYSIAVDHVRRTTVSLTEDEWSYREKLHSVSAFWASALTGSVGGYAVSLLLIEKFIISHLELP